MKCVICGSQISEYVSSDTCSGKCWLEAVKREKQCTNVRNALHGSFFQPL